MWNVEQATVIAFEAAAKNATGWPNRRDRGWEKNKEKVFIRLFSCSSSTVPELWERVNGIDDDGEKTVKEMKAQHHHLLWALAFLKIYAPNEMVHCAIFGWPDKETYRKYVWFFLKKISWLEDEIIVFDNRFDGQPNPNDIKVDCMITVDCTDCEVYEPQPFDTTMLSHKHNGPGLKYEVGVCIATGHIVWIGGPHPCGHGDLEVFRGELLKELEDWECVEADQGYRGEHRVKINPQGMDSKERKEKQVAQSCHEVVNSRLKSFNVLLSCFHHCQEG